MAATVRLSDEEVKAVANAVLEPEMADLGFDGVNVRSGETFDGEPSLVIDAKVGADVTAPFDPLRFGLLRTALHDALLARGEERYAYFSLDRAGDEPPDEETDLGEP